MSPLGRWTRRPTGLVGQYVHTFVPDPVDPLEALGNPTAAKVAEDQAIASFEAQLAPSARLPMSAPPQSVFSAHADPQRFPGL